MSKSHFNIEGSVIDLTLGAKIMGADQAIAKKMIAIMLDSASTEVKKLEAAYAKKDLNLLREVTHKLRGGVAYCGTPRLQHACDLMEEHLVSNKTEHLDELYQHLLRELAQVRAEYTP